MPLLLEDNGVRLSLQLELREDSGVHAEITLETRMGVLKLGDVFPWMEPFLEQLSASHQTLEGEAELRGYNGFRLRVSHASCGLISVEAIVDDPMADNLFVKASFRSDQSYIPQWVSSLRSDMNELMEAS
jgi:hypothetical protein